jgi:hypothetical protein
VLEQLESFSAEVVRLRVTFADGRAPLMAIAKRATGAELPAAQRELGVSRHLAPRWDHPAPALLGAAEGGQGQDAWLLLLFEDLSATGHALAATELSPAQLDGIIDVLVGFHARFWNRIPQEVRERPALRSVTRAAQAGPASVISEHAAVVRHEAESFLATGELAPADRALLEELLQRWEQRFLERIALEQITLIHGDFHLLGNLFFSPASPRPRVIDWSELKPGLGPHDVAYCMLSAPVAAGEDRVPRDLALLRRYRDGLLAAGVEHYSQELCHWDYRFSLLTNLFQSVLQRSAFWFGKTAAVAREHQALAALHRPPPSRG